MSWMQKLVETYDKCASLVGDYSNGVPLLPIMHVLQLADITIYLNERADFVGADFVHDDPITISPASETSAGRSGTQPAPHALFDRLAYVAGDLPKINQKERPKKKKDGGKPKDMESGVWFERQLKGWCDSIYAHNKVKIVYDYVQRKTLIQDLIAHGILNADDSGAFIDSWNKKGKKPKLKPSRCVVRFAVNIPGDCNPKLWADQSVFKSWIGYYSYILANQGNRHADCYVSGEKVLAAHIHPRSIRFRTDGTKLISSNDDKGFTYLGRFADANQSCSIGIETSHKAHAALRWLIARQGDRSGELATVAWAVGREPRTPNPLYNSAKLFKSSVNREVGEAKPYTAQEFGQKFRMFIQGYGTALGPTNDIVVMSLNSASKGRLAIKFYRELTGSEFLERLETWHTGCAWPWRFDVKKKRLYICAPSPKDIAKAAYGRSILGQSGAKLLATTVERLLPCIVDGALFPRDLVESCCRRACNRASFEKKSKETKVKGSKPSEQAMTWRETLGVACATYRYFHKEENYQMALERDRQTRDYLYGRLLALADRLEEAALYAAQEKRETNAARYMQRFADHPFSTWRTIELSLRPYQARLKVKRPGLLVILEKEIDEVMNLLISGEFISDERLSGEFLLGYHCQRAALYAHPKTAKDATEEEADSSDDDDTSDDTPDEE